YHLPSDESPQGSQMYAYHVTGAPPVLSLSAPTLLPCKPTEEPIAAIAQRAGKNAAGTCKFGSSKLKMTPAKMTCGISGNGTRLVARSLLGTKAEISRPVINPATDVRAIEMYISTNILSKMIPCKPTPFESTNGAFKLTTKTSTKACSKLKAPSTANLEKM